ncbi:right-handed parallel beta-helix repeat-containing protein [Enterococcus faecium]|uniref:right-handed parallel beta-helix repeat-containing protein n=1 Tax=Enterococcus faecium TaxID=1352 RepID=UPI001785AE01|nr:BppU family phage baseplate upper protein [Enterococcus faecium]MBD9902727.1 BppU family phage baseplate upper protein [Enterococcus faecium]
MVYKMNESIIVIQAEATSPNRTNVVFWSHDRGTAKLRMKLVRKNGIPQSLPEGTTVPIRLMFKSATAEGGYGKHDYLATVEDPVNGIVSIVLEDNILGYVGTVEGSVYIDFPNDRSLDTAGRFTFDIKRSPIDDSTPELEDYYFNGFSQTIDKIEKILADGKQEIDQKIAESETQIDAKLKDTNDKITKANQDVATLNTNIDKANDRIDQTNQQIGDIVKIRTDIDTLKINKADKEFVDAQLAQKVKKDELVVNVKDYGAKGDGVTNDTQAIQNALDTGKKVFIPKGTYMVSNLIPKGGQVIFGENAVDSWGTSIETSKTILKGMGGATDYVIKNRTWDTDGNPYPVVIQELTIDGNTKTTNGIRCGNSTTIERCRIINCIDGIVKVDVSRVTNCQIVNNTNGIREATDSKIDSNFIYQNDIGIYLINSNDNMVSSNKIEWNGVGIDISTSVFNLITGNIIDRQTTFGITSDSTSYITVTNNQFERNLTNHVLIQGSYWNVTGNSFYKKNSEDDMSGTLVPVSAIELKSASNCTFSANMVFGNKMFSSSYEYVSSNTFSNNAINGGSEVIKVSIPATTLAVGESKTLQIAFPVNYGTTSGWDVEVKKYKLATDSMTNYYQYNGVEIYIHNNNGVYVKLTNNFSTEKTFSGTIWLDHIAWSKR